MFGHAITRRNRIARAFATTALVIFSAAACGDDTAGPEPEPDVAIMRITAGTQTINVNAKTGAVTGGPLTIAAGAQVPVTVQFLRANGQADPLVLASTFRISGTSANAAVATFTGTTSFAGTIRGVQAGTTSVTIGLFHIEENHNEFQWPVSVTVTAQ